MRTLETLTAATLTLTLFGCGGTSNINTGGWIDCNSDVCAGGVTATVPFDYRGSEWANNFFPSTLAMNFTGSSVTFPASGFGTITAFDISGQTVGITPIGWTFSSNSAILSNPNAVTSWLSGLSSNFSKLEITIENTQVGVQPGVNEVHATIEHDYENIVTVGEIWTVSNCGNDVAMGIWTCLE